MEALKHVTKRFGHLWDDVCDFIIRPDRATYSVAELGPPVFRISDCDGTIYQRVDIDLCNMRGMKIVCSWYRPQNKEDNPPMPCVIYLHGNCGSRLDGLEILHLLRHGMTLFTYDACGSGQSDGDHVSLGFYERQDLASVIEFLQASRRVSTIGLWGRSMGAVTSFMFASKDPSITAIVADSPFSTLRALVADLVEQHGSWVPSIVTSAAVARIRKMIMKKAAFDIDDLNTLKYASQCHVPCFIFHGKDDDFVFPRHSMAVSDAYGGSCMHHLVGGNHNSNRGPDLHSVAAPFLELYLIQKPEAAAQRLTLFQSLAPAAAPPRPPPPPYVEEDSEEAVRERMSSDD